MRNVAQAIYASWLLRNVDRIDWPRSSAPKMHPKVSTTDSPAVQLRGMGQSPMVTARSEYVPPENGRGASIIGKQEDGKTTREVDNARTD